MRFINSIKNKKKTNDMNPKFFLSEKEMSDFSCDWSMARCLLNHVLADFCLVLFIYVTNTHLQVNASPQIFKTLLNHNLYFKQTD